MPPVSSVLENCVAGQEGGNESQPVDGLCEGHRTRRADLEITLFKSESLLLPYFIVDTHHAFTIKLKMPTFQMLVAVLQRCSSSASGKIYWKLQKEKALHRNLKPRAKKDVISNTCIMLRLPRNYFENILLHIELNSTALLASSFISIMPPYSI